jgi:hypothetical protein
MKKHITILILLLITLILFSGAYINTTTIRYSNSDMKDFQQEKVLQIGVTHEHELFKDFFLGYDAKYISDKLYFEESIKGFGLGYASYDFWLSYSIGYIKLAWKHNCTHKFENAFINLYWQDNSYDTVQIELLF